VTTSISELPATLFWLSPRVAKHARPDGIAQLPSAVVWQLTHLHIRPCCLPLAAHRKHVQD
jgi:hypothetical protein